MKKIFGLLITLFIFYFILQICFRYFGKGHIYEYKIKNEKEFNIKEVFTQNTKNEVDNYYIEIEVENNIFNFQIYDVLKRTTGIIKDIKYFENANYKCILPYLDNNKQFTDMVCKKDNIYYYYSNIKGKDPELDNFASEYFDLSIYNDKDEMIKHNKNIYIYNNLPEKNHISIDYYKGIYVINSKSNINRIQIFDKEKYNRDISVILDKYYITADYDEKYEFHKFKIVNIENNKIDEIISDYAISFDSYIQGIVDNEIYLFDKMNKMQYKINIKNKQVIIVGNEKGIKIYKNGEFVDGNAYEASQINITFNKYNTDNNSKIDGYEILGMNGNVQSGYILVYKKVNNVYNVYKINVQNKDIVTYLFTTTDINQIQSDYKNIYYKDGKYIKYFNEINGIKTIIKDNELEFNNGIKFYVYSK